MANLEQDLINRLNALYIACDNAGANQNTDLIRAEIISTNNLLTAIATKKTSGLYFAIN